MSSLSGNRKHNHRMNFNNKLYIGQIIHTHHFQHVANYIFRPGNFYRISAIIEGIFSDMANSVTVNFYWKGDIYAKKRYNGT